MNKLPPIGCMGYITGHPMTSENVWRRTYPQNIYGKVIKHVRGLANTKCLLVRCIYKYKNETKAKHFHLKIAAKYFQSI